MKVFLVVFVLLMLASVFSEELKISLDTLPKDSQKAVKDNVDSVKTFDLDLSIGASFDFVNKVYPNSVYGDLVFEWIDMWKTVLKNRHFNNRICGMTVYLSNGRIVSADSLTGSSQKTDIFSTSLALNAQLFRESKSIFIIGYLEARKKHFELDSLSVMTEGEFWGSAIGGGLLFHTKNKPGKINLKLIVVREFEYYEADGWHFVGIGQFNYVSIHNVKIGVDVRGRLERQKKHCPEMLIHLSKVFNIEKMLEFLGN